ncbi:Superoxide dismutase [Cu-Zn], variant 2 [Balamuthia mandrillaris]
MTMWRCCLCLVVLVVALSSLSSAQLQNKAFVGHCQLMATEAGEQHRLTGSIIFRKEQNDDPRDITTVSVQIEGFNLQTHAIHVHEFGDISDKESGLSTGGHFVGGGSIDHGCPPNPERHAGDMGNWTAVQRRITEDRDLDLLELTGEDSILGRSVVVHERADDCGQPVGNAGGRLGICVIGVAAQDFNRASLEDENIRQAVAVLQPLRRARERNLQLSGTVLIRRKNSGVLQIIARIEGLKAGTVHAIGIHHNGDVSDSAGNTAGERYNPDAHAHHLPPVVPRPWGDLGNIQSYDSEGVAWYMRDEPNIKSLSDIIGRSIVIFDDRDHGDGKGCDANGLFLLSASWLSFMELTHLFFGKQVHQDQD